MITPASQGAPTILVFSVFLDFLQEGIEKIKDPRSKSNGTKFKISDAMLSAFSTTVIEVDENLPITDILKLGDWY
jgi:hypothetical protein